MKFFFPQFLFHKRIYSKEKLSPEDPMKRYGYLRVSTEDQTVSRQRLILEDLNINEYFEEKASGKSRDRPVLNHLLSILQKGDELVVESISRLARSTRDFLNILQELDDRGVKFRSIKENINSSEASGRFTLTIHSAVASYEREMIVDRVRSGIRSAKLRGVKFGKPESLIPDEFFELQLQVCRKQITREDLMAKFGIGRSTYYYWLKRTRNLSLADYRAGKRSA